jgi:hypothetical protein
MFGAHFYREWMFLGNFLQRMQIVDWRATDSAAARVRTAVARDPARNRTWRQRLCAGACDNAAAR